MTFVQHALQANFLSLLELRPLCVIGAEVNCYRGTGHSLLSRRNPPGCPCRCDNLALYGDCPGAKINLAYA
jgi:hypothetical protein